MIAGIVFDVVISMFLVMAVGYLCRKIGIIDEIFSKRLSKLVLYVTQPVLIVASMIKMKSSAENNGQILLVLIISLLAHAFCAVIGFISMRVIKEENERKLSEHSIIFANIMFLGLPMFEVLYGDRGVLLLSFYSIVFHIAAWTYGLVVLGRGRGDVKLNLKKMLLNCGTMRCTIGVGLYFMSIDWPTGIVSALNYVGGLCTPISLLVLGGVLATVPLKKLFSDWRIYYTCFIKLIFVPICVFLISKYIVGLGSDMCLFTTLAVAIPTASLTNMFAEMYDIEPGYAAKSVGITTVFAVGTLPLITYLTQIL